MVLTIGIREKQFVKNLQKTKNALTNNRLSKRFYIKSALPTVV
jgi:hypothetical protein